MSDTRFYVLDSFRGVAAFSVAYGHFGLIPSHTYIYAVDFFLVLSGFILTHSYFVDRHISIKDFAMRRFFRMYPLHAITLLSVIIIFVIIGQNIVLEETLLHLFFVQNIGFGPDRLALNRPGWTISVEFWINVFAFILIVHSKANSFFLCLCVCIILIMSFSIIFIETGHLDVHVEDYWGFLNSGLLRCLASFFLGYLSYKLYEKSSMWRPSNLVMIVSLIAFFSVILTLPGRSIAGFLVPFIFSIVVLVFAKGQGTIPQILGKFSSLGDISYSIYLTHYPIILLFWLIYDGNEYMGALVFTLVTIFVSTLVHRYFEKPTYGWLMNMTKEIRTR